MPEHNAILIEFNTNMTIFTHVTSILNKLPKFHLLTIAYNIKILFFNILKLLGSITTQVPIIKIVF